MVLSVKTFIALATVFCLLPPMALSQVQEDATKSDAVSTFSTGKVIWDFPGNLRPRDSVNYLKRVLRIYESLSKQGIEPDMILILRILSEHDVAKAKLMESAVIQKLRDEHKALLAKILSKPGVQAIADRGSRELFNTRLRSRVKFVDDVFVPLINYQAQGYVLVPIYPAPVR